MKKFKPDCYGKCHECFFYFINGCVALPAEDCFLQINKKQAFLIINNKKRFELPDQIANKLIKKFPEVENNVEY